LRRVDRDLLVEVGSIAEGDGDDRVAMRGAF